MNIDVTVEAVIERPSADVAAYASDPSNAPRWYRRIHSADWETEPPVAIGTRVTFRARFLGRDLEYTYEVVEYVPGQRLLFRTTQGPFPMNTEYTWHALGPASTRMTLRNYGQPTGFASVTAPIMRLAMRRAMSGDMEQLKRILETQAA